MRLMAGQAEGMLSSSLFSNLLPAKAKGGDYRRSEYVRFGCYTSKWSGRFHKRGSGVLLIPCGKGCSRQLSVNARRLLLIRLFQVTTIGSIAECLAQPSRGLFASFSSSLPTKNLPAVLGRVPLARGFQVSAMRPP